MRRRVARWVKRNRLHIALVHMAVMGAAVLVLVLVLPDVSNTTTAVLVVVGDAVASLLAVADLIEGGDENADPTGEP